ncbi:ABC transporter substrate-binding protein [Alphaproteobacteria bacterium KMM 3653]|uniref:ABC transporter substrate-binding protein n=2 Tax=Harenicola maris TaxID=2841044 RepID=A0AAP2G4Q9_9RHOB|nr:ABC transporter substrate-binding protein [Harenicola maris]
MRSTFGMGLALWAVVQATAGAAQEFPVTVTHAFGATVVEEAPVRVASVGWANHEVPLALGIVPVGFARASWGDDDGDGLLPWVTERLEALGAEAPVLFDEGDGIDFEAVASTNPDVILAAYSGISQSDYETLSRIAPVIAYPDAAWTTTWREMMSQNAAGLGMAEEGAALVADIEGRIAKAVAGYPELRGKTGMFVTHLDIRDLSTIGFYADADQRVQFLTDLGMETPQAVREASEAGKYSGRVSTERIDLFNDVDLVVTYGDEARLAEMSDNALIARFPAIARGSVVLLANDPMGTAANPTPLSIDYVLDDYLGRLAEAAARAGE